MNYKCQLDVQYHSPAASDLSGIPDGRIAGNARATAGREMGPQVGTLIEVRALQTRAL